MLGLLTGCLAWHDSTLLLLYTYNFGHLALIEVQKDSKIDDNEPDNQGSNW